MQTLKALQMPSKPNWETTMQCLIFLGYWPQSITMINCWWNFVIFSYWYWAEYRYPYSLVFPITIYELSTLCRCCQGWFKEAGSGVRLYDSIGISGWDHTPPWGLVLVMYRKCFHVCAKPNVGLLHVIFSYIRAPSSTNAVRVGPRSLKAVDDSFAHLAKIMSAFRY